VNGAIRARLGRTNRLAAVHMFRRDRSGWPTLCGEAGTLGGGWSQETIL
jgi:hypothetical protein